MLNPKATTPKPQRFRAPTLSRRISTAAILTIASALALPSAFAPAGPINPPPGPVAPTHKTLTEIEPRTIVNAANTPGDADSLFKITSPGSYYLTENITGVADKHGIEIDAPNVTLDLMGFTLTGVTGSLTGIMVANSAITVRNGYVQQWGADGVRFDFGFGAIRNVFSYSNADIGIRAGNYSTVADCKLALNGHGVDAGEGTVISGCVATFCEFVLGDGCAISNCVAAFHSAPAIAGIRTGRACSITNCTVINFAGDGIVAQASNITGCSVYSSNIGIWATEGCTISDCTATNNDGFGISVFAGTVSNCRASANNGGINLVGPGTATECVLAGNSGDGLTATGATVLSRCTASNNTGSGIAAGPGTTIIDCTADGNTLRGISADTGSSVTNCVCRTNGEDGILATSACQVRANTCRQNLGAGINISGSSNRIEGNACSFADFGIRIQGTRNIIVRNTCSDNTTNWSIVAGNSFGPIIDRSAAATPSVNGNSALSTLGTTDTNANFTN